MKFVLTSWRAGGPPMKFVLSSWRAAWIRRRAEIMFTVGMGVGFAIVYEISKWV